MDISPTAFRVNVARRNRPTSSEVRDGVDRGEKTKSSKVNDSLVLETIHDASLIGSSSIYDHGED